MPNPFNPQILRARLNRFTLRQRMLFSLLIPLLIGLSVLVIVGRSQAHALELRLITGRQKQLVTAVEDQITGTARTLREDVLTLANSPLTERLNDVAVRLAATGERSEQDRVALQQAYSQALDDLANEFYLAVLRTEAFAAIRLVNLNGDELLHVEQPFENDLTPIGTSAALANVTDMPFFQDSVNLAVGETHVSGLALLDGRPVIHITSPLFFQENRVGGLTVDVDASILFRYVSGQDSLVSSSDSLALVLVDARGLYLADTRLNRAAGQPLAYLFGQDPANGATLFEREPVLGHALSEEVSGQSGGGLIFTSHAFNPYGVESAGTPWTLIVLEDVHAVLSPGNRLGLPLVVVSTGIVVVVAALLWQISTTVIRPVTQAAEIADQVAEGDLSARIPIHREDEIGRLSHAVNSMTSRLLENISLLEGRFRERTRDLEVAAEIVSIAVNMEDISALLDLAVRIIQERFDFYHVQVFLVDEYRTNARLVASTGAAGQAMLNLNWALAVGSDSLIGQVTQSGEAAIVSVMGDGNTAYRPNPYLPETRSEMAVPMRHGAEIIGVLDIRSTSPNAFGEEDVRIFEVLARQLAIAVDNVRLLEETRQQVSRVEQLNRQLTREAWRDFLDSQSAMLSGISGAGSISDIDGEPGAFSVPIEVRGEVIGALTTAPLSDSAFDPDEITLIQAVAERVALAVENARLVTETQTSLEETRVLYDTGSAIADESTAKGILDVLVEHAASESVNFAQLFILNGKDWHVSDATITVAASWTNDFAPDLSGMRFTAEQYPHWDELSTTSLLVIDDVEESPLLTEESCLGYMALGIKSLVVVPLEAGGIPTGALMFGSGSAHRHSDRELRIYQNLAELATISLENIDLLQQTQTRARQLQISADVSRAVTSILDINQLLPRVVDLISDTFNYDHVQVYLLDETGETALLRASTGEVGRTMMNMNWSLNVDADSVIARVIVLAEPVIALDTVNAKVAHRPNPFLPNTRSEMAIPLVSRGEVVGVLDVQSNQPSAFDNEDLTVLTSLADQIAVALDNARLFEVTQDYTTALSEQIQSLQGLLQANQHFSKSLNAQDILDAAARYAVELFGVDHSGIVIAVDDRGDRGQVRAEYPDTDLLGTEFALNRAWWHEAAEYVGQPVVVGDVMTSYMMDDLTRSTVLKLGFNEVVLVPFVSGNRVVGLIGLDMYKGGREFTSEELTLLQLFATQLSAAYQNARLFDQAQEQAKEMGFLFNVTTAAAGFTEMESSMRTVVEQVGASIPGDVIAVYLSSDDENALQKIAVQSISPEFELPDRLPVSGWIVRQAVAERKPFLVDDLRLIDETHGMAAPLHSLMAAPLVSGGEIAGMLVILKAEANVYRESNLRLLQALSSSLNAVVQNIQLLEEVQAANDRLRELDKIKSQFLANMSHELRTPLNSIIGFSRVILKGIDGPLTEMQEQDLTTIHSSGQHLLNLINDILDQAKIEADKLSINVNWFELGPVIDVARSMSIGLLKDRDVRLNVEVEENLPQVWGDEIRTRQVLLNLLSNAAKFTYEGSITIAAFAMQLEDGPYVQVAVSDTGIGIPANKLGSVFVAFEQVDGSLTRTSGGTGLGLPISKSLIEMMGGELWVESTLNVGSTFSFCLPAYAREVEADVDGEAGPAEDLLKPDAGVPIEQQELPERKIVMIIDDEVGVHQMYRRYLNKAGYTVEATSNPNQAEELIRIIHPDIIILDVRMPYRDGWDVLGQIKTSDETRHIPVIICSIETDVERSLTLGAVAHLTKPFPEEKLLAAIEEADRKHVRDRVLIVDDKPETVRLVVELLRQAERYYVQTATSGQQALEMLNRKRPDLVVLGLNMPETSGLELLQHLRSNPRTYSLPVLVLTAEDELAAQEREQLADVRVYSKHVLDEGGLMAGINALLGYSEDEQQDEG